MIKVVGKNFDIEQFAYQLRNWRSRYGSLKVDAGTAIGKMLGALTVHGSLSAVLCQRVGDSAWNGGRLVNLGLLGKRVVTDAGVAHLVDDWQDGSGNISNFNYHDSGTDNTAEAQTQTNLIAEAGPTTRATGVLTQPSANVVQSVGTITYGGTLAIVEHGLFSTASRATDLMWDRTVFAAINVVSSDAIEFTYQATFTAGS